MTTRTVKVARMHTNAWPFLIAWPVGIVVVTFLITYGVFLAVGDTNDGQSHYTGGVSAMFGLALAFYLQAMTQTFPFALGISVTRREFFTGTTLVAVLQSLGLGVGLFVAGAIERATDGWGKNMQMFDVTNALTSNPAIKLGTDIVFVLLVAGVGLFLGSLYQRWRTPGLFATALFALIVFGILAISITWQGWWTDLGHWFVDLPRAVPMVVLPAALAVLAFAAAWGVMRRATP
ncbi:ABC transporter permease [Antrihabitans cavernicola]|uniref:ABC transporter permease n=1 Tax=Antrihabitans cavernicola TaxID=2495913 RepID=A0A5A7SBH0_9NOCA|nr:ABC transporter permease [Spelaeibacter cavernicola]KAA0023266.1 ABC transporter permease [Spelaeibacter cavernicola]